MRFFPAVISILLLVCSRGASTTTGALARHYTTLDILTRYMPYAMDDGVIKIAVVRSQSVSEHIWQFLSDCVSEGRSMGFTVDTFIVREDTPEVFLFEPRIIEAAGR